MDLLHSGTTSPTALSHRVFLETTDSYMSGASYVEYISTICKEFSICSAE